VEAGATEEVFGVIRTDVLKTTPLIAEDFGSDKPLLVELALRGRFGLVPEPLFLSRTHPERLSYLSYYMTPAQRLAWWSPAKAGRRDFEIWRLYVTCLRLVLRLVPYRMERLRCYGYLLRSLPLYGRWFRLALEPVTAVVPAAARIEGPLFRSLPLRILRKISRALGVRPPSFEEEIHRARGGGPHASVVDGLAGRASTVGSSARTGSR
jgi:hypothetical protein